MSASAADHAWMARALQLAARGLYTTQPNPRVGCVLVRDDACVGDGWHVRAGEAHAEVLALHAAGERARGATAYVTLEPCAHHGRTPPCVDALIAAGVARVVVAMTDPNPKVAGRGLQRLREAGIAVDVGLLAEPAGELNRGFCSRMQRARPWLRIKLAMSLDGRTALANGRSQWISGDGARADVQHWRARSSAILTGSATVLADDPRLTVRLGAAAGDVHVAPADAAGGRAGIAAAAAPSPFVQPLRVVLDAALRIPAQARVLDASAPTLLLHAPPATLGGARHGSAELLAMPSHAGRLDLAAVLAELARRGANEVQVEAGPTLCGALFAAGLVDELLLYVAPVLLGDAARPLLHLPPLQDMAARWRLRLVEQRAIGSDWRLLLRPAASGAE